MKMNIRKILLKKGWKLVSGDTRRDGSARPPAASKLFWDAISSDWSPARAPQGPPTATGEGCQVALRPASWLSLQSGPFRMLLSSSARASL